MIKGAAERLRYFFRPFRRGEYQHAPSIEELHLMHQERSPRATSLWRKFIYALTEIGRR